MTVQVSHPLRFTSLGFSLRRATLLHPIQPCNGTNHLPSPAINTSLLFRLLHDTWFTIKVHNTGRHADHQLQLLMVCVKKDKSGSKGTKQVNSVSCLTVLNFKLIN